MKTKPMADAEYTLLLEAYDGSGGFKNGNYLTPHKRETADNYNTRKNWRSISTTPKWWSIRT